MMQFTRGDTFEFYGPVTLTVNGTPTTDLTGYTALSQVRTASGKLVDNLDVTFDSVSPAVIRLAAPGPTTSWPVGAAAIDIQFTSPAGRIISTESAAIEILRDVTRT